MFGTRTRPAGPTAAVARPQHKGVGRSSDAKAERVSDDLRRGSGRFLQQRRRAAGLTFGAMAAYGVVGLYQFGILKHVPEPPLPLLDADKVDASGEAYVLLHTPDSTLGIASAGVTLALAGMGSAQRWREQPWVPVATAAKVALDAAGSAYLLVEQLTKHRKICSWCTAAAVFNLLAVPAVIPEAQAAWKVWRRGPH